MAWIRTRRAATGLPHYSVQWRDRDGRIHSRALGAVPRPVAEAELREAQERTRTASGASRLLAAFLDHLRLTGRSAATLDFYGRRLGDWCRAMSGRPVRSWNRRHLEAYVAGQRWSPRSCQMLVRAASTWIRWAAETGRSLPDFVAGFRGPPVSPRPFDAMVGDDVGRLLAATRGTPLEPAVALAAYCGLRRRDVLDLTWEEIDLDVGMIVRDTAKTRQRVRLPIPPQLSAILRRIRPDQATGPVCTGLPASEAQLHAQLRRACDRAGVPRGGFHRLRHGFATTLQRTGHDLATIRELLGHRPGSVVTLRYFHSDDTRRAAAMRDVADAIGGCGSASELRSV